jgi:molybdopterin/thiamine biosynthesis adenylyltransferase
MRLRLIDVNIHYRVREDLLCHRRQWEHADMIEFTGRVATVTGGADSAGNPTGIFGTEIKGGPNCPARNYF